MKHCSSGSCMGRKGKKTASGNILGIYEFGNIKK
jgi:hypothetical protein